MTTREKLEQLLDRLSEAELEAEYERLREVVEGEPGDGAASREAGARPSRVSRCRTWSLPCGAHAPCTDVAGLRREPRRRVVPR